MLSSFQARESRQCLCVCVCLFSVKRQGHKQKRQTVYFPKSPWAGPETKTTNRLISKKKLPSRVINKNDKRFIFKKTAGSQTKTANRLFSKKSPLAGSQTKTTNRLFIHHSAFPIRHSVLVIHHSAFKYVCMRAKKHTAFLYHIVIKN